MTTRLSDLVGRTVGGYRIDSLVGRGGMGEVYKAEHLKLRRQVALKLLPPEYAADEERRRRFEQEAQAVAKLNHPNIVTIFSIEEAEGLSFLTMELVEGDRLSELIPRNGMDIDRLLEIALPLTDALRAAHSRGVIHRDLKPQNVMVSDEGRVKVLDFGLARLTRADTAASDSDLEGITASLTEQGRVIGTLPYMAPEQVKGRPADARSDIFSLGVILYQMATGVRPFRGASGPDLIAEILTTEPPAPDQINPRLPRHLGRIIGHCLRKDPDARFQSAKELFNQLDEYKTEVEASRMPTSSFPIAQPPRRWRTALLAGAALLAGLIVVAVVAGLLTLGGAPDGAAPGKVAPAGGTTAMRQKIVVLPFQNLGPPEEEYFASGIADEIATRLGAVSDLGVISRLSALQYADGGKSLEQIGAELDVDFVLEGTVRWSRDVDGNQRVRVLPKLNRVADNIQIWSAPYERVLEDIFDVQTDIAQEVLRQLELTIEAARAGLARPPTRELEAYRAYLRGIDLSNNLSYDDDALRRAAGMFARATEIDPEFSLAFARLSRIHSYLYFNYTAPEDLTLARQALDRALELDPELPEVRVAAGFFRYYGLKDFGGALEQFNRAAESLPNDVDVLRGIGWVLRRLGRLEEAVRKLERAFELDPRVGYSALVVAETRHAMRDYQAAARFLDQAISLAPDHAPYWADRARNELMRTASTTAARRLLAAAPVAPEDPALAEFDIQASLYDRDWEAAVERFPGLDAEWPDPYTPLRTSWQVALALERLGREEAARRRTERDLRLLEEKIAERAEDGFLLSLRAISLARLGRPDEALRTAERAVALRADDAFTGPFLQEEMAVTLTLSGRPDEAVALLGKLLRTDYQKAISRTRLRLDPVWDPLRSHPGFAELVDR